MVISIAMLNYQSVKPEIFKFFFVCVEVAKGAVFCRWTTGLWRADANPTFSQDLMLQLLVAIITFPQLWLSPCPTWGNTGMQMGQAPPAVLSRVLCDVKERFLQQEEKTHVFDVRIPHESHVKHRHSTVRCVMLTVKQCHKPWWP